MSAERFRSVLGAIGAVLVVVAIIVAGYLGGWWLRKDTTNRSARITRRSFEVQETYREEARRSARAVTDIDVQLVDPALTTEQRDALEAQRRAVVTQACDQIARITSDTPADIDQFNEKEC